MSLYLGLDLSTQSLTAVVIDPTAHAIVREHSVNFDRRLPRFHSRNGVLPGEDPSLVHADPRMWAAALDLMFEDLVRAGLDLGRVRAIAGSGQQHGSVYLTSEAAGVLRSLEPTSTLETQIATVLARPTAPVWMDSSTRAQCEAIASAVGGDRRVAELTGSRCYERFTGPQIRKFWQENPQGYAATARVHLVSSFMASLLVGRHAPIDHGDGSGMNLMDIAARRWSSLMLRATAPGLGRRLARLAPSDRVVGRVHRYFVRKYGLAPGARVVVWSGDNPCSLIGVGLVRPGKVCVSLGTSDTYFGCMPALKVSSSGEGHVFCAPTGDYMSLICYLNGSLAREAVRETFGLTWHGFSDALRRSRPGNGGKVLLPYFAPEITPPVAAPHVVRYGLAASDAEGYVRGVVEAQMASMAVHARWMGVKPRTICATGGAAVNREILKIMANVHNAEVYRLQTANAAALGAALRAVQADLKASGHAPSWPEVVAGFTAPEGASRILPDPAAVRVYREFVKLYEACEAHALRGGRDPSRRRQRFAERFGAD